MREENDSWNENESRLRTETHDTHAKTTSVLHRDRVMEQILMRTRSECAFFCCCRGSDGK